MSGEMLLDTNIVIGIFAEDDSIIAGLEATDTVYLPVIVIGELYYGALKSLKPDANLKQIYQFADACIILDCDADTARVYGEIKNHLKAKGKPIPENDIWIAALARQHDVPLVSRDRHFREVDNLNIVEW